MTNFYYIDDVNALREKLARAERDGTLMGQVWGSVRRRARQAPAYFPWFTPFVALMTEDATDIAHAQEAIRGYLATLDPQTFGMGMQFHFWCFAFPHARWSLYFHWLQQMGAWEDAEARQMREELLTCQYVNFFYGMRTKPEPECVDNQAMSLCFSNALLGQLFSDSAMAQRMQVDGLRRLPDLIGGIPPSGYSGEGSTYMDAVVGPSIPFIVELLERAHGGDWFNRALPPGGGSAASVCQMIAREWMPNGLLLPWDHYGYSLPMRSCIAFAAHRTHDPRYSALLEQYANWAYDQSIGWGFDDLVWSLIWWPEQTSQTQPTFVSWCAPEVGAALVSDDAQLYCLQMWDASTPVYPTRAHVNPNALVLSAYGSPLTIDGIPDAGCTAFNFADTWREVHYMDMSGRKFNFGAGCGGAHSILLVDNWEGMRASSEYPQARCLPTQKGGKSVSADVTPIYQEQCEDVRMVRRRTRCCHDRFWLIEDLALFAGEHDVTARFFLRPQLIASEHGVTIETAEGIRLSLIPLLGPDSKTVTPVVGYPERLDGESLMVDFTQRGSECRWLWLAWPEATRQVAQDVSDGWETMPDATDTLEFADAASLFAEKATLLPLTVPPFMQRDLPVVKRWWFRRSFTVPACTPSWIRLPKQMHGLRLWIDGVAVDLSSHKLRMNLLEPEILLPSQFAGHSVDIILCCDIGYSQYAPDGQGGSGFCGHPVILTEQSPSIMQADYCDGTVHIRCGDAEWTVLHTLMEKE